MDNSISSRSLMIGNVSTEESRNEIRKSPGAPSPPANATIFCFHPFRLVAKRNSSISKQVAAQGLEEFLLATSLNGWKQKIVAFAGGLGAPGLFLISFLDSSVLTFPIINDLLLIELSLQHPARMSLYAFMAALGSVLGCVVLYFIARKGGEALFHRKAGEHADRIRHWVENNGFGGMLLAALLPPPTPFKFFVLAAGVFEVPILTFASAIALARI